MISFTEQILNNDMHCVPLFVQQSHFVYIAAGTGIMLATYCQEDHALQLLQSVELQIS
jgi:hypothetical protein